MTLSAPLPARRLDLLEKYLEEDPGNGHLLAEACEAAIVSGQALRALGQIRTAQSLALDPVAWTFLHARACIAQKDLGQAQNLLTQLLADHGAHSVLAHDLAFVRFLQDDYVTCRELLRPWLADAGQKEAMPPEQAAALQVLWLRASHRLRLLAQSLNSPNGPARLPRKSTTGAKAVSRMLPVAPGTSVR